MKKLMTTSELRKSFDRTVEGFKLLRVVLKENYFGDCPRDAAGHCKPKGSADESGGKEGEPAPAQAPTQLYDQYSKLQKQKTLDFIDELLTANDLSPSDTSEAEEFLKAHTGLNQDEIDSILNDLTNGLTGEDEMAVSFDDLLEEKPSSKPDKEDDDEIVLIDPPDVAADGEEPFDIESHWEANEEKPGVFPGEEEEEPLVAEVVPDEEDAPFAEVLPDEEAPVAEQPKEAPKPQNAYAQNTLGIDTSSWPPSTPMSYQSYIANKLESYSLAAEAGNLEVLKQQQSLVNAAVSQSLPGQEQYTNALVQGYQKAISIASAKAGVLNFDEMKKIGGQLGSNPGGLYEAPDGKKYYVKFSKSEKHAKNELLATKLYDLAGAAIPTHHAIQTPKGLGTASEWVEDKWAFSPSYKTGVDAVVENYGVHAWLANWDAVGMSFDNQVLVGDKAMTIDAGGSMLFRAQGAPKEFHSTSVPELKSLADPKFENNYAVFGQMTPQQRLGALKKVAVIKDDAIIQMVNKYGPGDPAEKTALAATLISRKAIIAKEAEKLEEQLAPKPLPTEDLPEAQAEPPAAPPKPPEAPPKAVAPIPATMPPMAIPPMPTAFLSKNAKWYQKCYETALTGDIKAVEALYSGDQKYHSKQLREKYKQQVLTAMKSGAKAAPSAPAPAPAAAPVAASKPSAPAPKPPAPPKASNPHIDPSAFPEKPWALYQDTKNTLNEVEEAALAGDVAKLDGFANHGQYEEKVAQYASKLHAVVNQQLAKAKQPTTMSQNFYAMKPQDIDPTWTPPPGASGKVSYGVVLVNNEGKVLLREPSGHYGGYAWTFAKGKQEIGQSPSQTAIAESEQETGHTPKFTGTLPGAFAGDTGYTHYFFGEVGGVDTSKMDTETSDVKWVTFDEAEQLINQTTSVAGKKRDLEVLAAAKSKYQESKPLPKAAAPAAAPAPVPAPAPAPKPIVIDASQFPEKPSWSAKPTNDAKKVAANQLEELAKKGDVKGMESVDTVGSTTLGSYKQSLIDNVNEQLNPPKPPEPPKAYNGELNLLTKAYANKKAGKAAGVEFAGHYMIIDNPGVPDLDLGTVYLESPTQPPQSTYPLYPPKLDKQHVDAFKKMSPEAQEKLKGVKGDPGHLHAQFWNTNEAYYPSGQHFDFAKEMIEKCPELPVGAQLQRVVGLNKTDAEKLANSVGCMVQEPSITETSARKSWDWSVGGTKVHWKFTAAPGAKGIYVNTVHKSYDHEMSMILPPGQRYLIKSATWKGTGYDKKLVIEAYIMPTIASQSSKHQAIKTKSFNEQMLNGLNDLVMAMKEEYHDRYVKKAVAEVKQNQWNDSIGVEIGELKNGMEASVLDLYSLVESVSQLGKTISAKDKAMVTELRTMVKKQTELFASLQEKQVELFSSLKEGNAAALSKQEELLGKIVTMLDKPTPEPAPRPKRKLRVIHGDNESTIIEE